MILQNLTCNSCGAPLQVPDTANFVTCNHCSTQLTIRRSENFTFTEQLDRLTERTEELSERLDGLSSHNELSALDRDWGFEQKKYMVKDKNGGEHIPTEAGSIGGGVMITLFGCLWTGLAFAMTSSAPDVGPFPVVKIVFPLFGLIFIGAGIATSMSSYSKAGKYRLAEERYQRRRDELLRKSQS